MFINEIGEHNYEDIEKNENLKDIVAEADRKTGGML
jgi:hypothetical protein